ncbi:MAG: hypothetical protein ABMB14_15810 [Myxococcota bacterium]
MDYKLSKQRGALNEVEAAVASDARAEEWSQDYARAHQTAVIPQSAMVAPPMRARQAPAARRRGWWVTVDEGERVLVTDRSGASEIVAGPKRLFGWRKRIVPLTRWTAHPGEFLIVRRRDGEQQHLVGPTHLWEDPREHQKIEVEEVLRLDAKEAVVVYAGAGTAVSRRIVHGPTAVVPAPGEWLHQFSWHGSRWNGTRYVKIPNALVFQKLWLMPDQMYHDVPDVRTADDALLTVRLMVFFELVDIERMLESTHDPIGDIVNAATSDVIDWVGRYEFEAFKRNTEQLNDLATYKQLVSRADQCGYRIHKVVYRGYGATEALQRMHDEAIESRTRLALERATEHQAQELEDGKLEREHARATRRRTEDAAQVAHAIDVARRRQEAELADAALRRAFDRAERDRDAAAVRSATEADRASERAHLEGLHALGVDLTRLLTQAPADQVIELRGGASPHVHLNRD